MQTQRINISLPYDIAKRLQREVPKGTRSSFVAKAVSEKLGEKQNSKKELVKYLKANYGFYKKEYEDWKGIELDAL